MTPRKAFLMVTEIALSGYHREIFIASVHTHCSANIGTGPMELDIEFADADSSGAIHLQNKCGFDLEPRIRLVVPPEVTPVSVVWKDNLNRTFATDTHAVTLPPLREFFEDSRTKLHKCTQDCPTSWNLKVAASDGSHARVDIEAEKPSMDGYVIHLR